MPKDRTVTTYQYAELTPKAQAKARDWYREGFIFDDDTTIDDFKRVCTALGVTIGTWQERYNIVGQPGTRERTRPCVFWSGFSSQGDGASFSGSYRATGEAEAAIRQYAPDDDRLHAIGATLDQLRADLGIVTGRITHDRGARYSHDGTMFAEAYDADGNALPGGFRDTMRHLAQWLYRALETEYEYQTSDAAVAETIEANEYEFTEDGERYPY